MTTKTSTYRPPIHHLHTTPTLTLTLTLTPLTLTLMTIPTNLQPARPARPTLHLQPFVSLVLPNGSALLAASLVLLNQHPSNHTVFHLFLMDKMFLVQHKRGVERQLRFYYQYFIVYLKIHMEFLHLYWHQHVSSRFKFHSRWKHLVHSYLYDSVLLLVVLIWQNNQRHLIIVRILLLQHQVSEIINFFFFLSSFISQ